MRSAKIAEVLGSPDGYKEPGGGSGVQGGGQGQGGQPGRRRSASRDRTPRRNSVGLDSVVTYERGGGGVGMDEVSMGVEWYGDGVSTAHILLVTDTLCIPTQ